MWGEHTTASARESARTDGISHLYFQLSGLPSAARLMAAPRPRAARGAAASRRSHAQPRRDTGAGTGLVMSTINATIFHLCLLCD